MASSLQERYEKFSSCLVNEFEMYIEVQRINIEGDTPPNAKLTGIATNSIKEVFSSTAGAVCKALSGVNDLILHQRQLDKAGKVITLIDKYQNPEEKKAIRAMLVRVAYELFRSFEYQFMNAEKSQGGWSQAMVQLARSAVWCFMHCYKFNAKENLDEKYVLDGITLKNMPNVGIWKKLYYQDEKKSKKVTNTDDQVKWDGDKMYSKVGVLLYENQQPIYYKNKLTKPEKYGFRRVFSHETEENIKSEYTVTKPPVPVTYQYILDMGTDTKKRMCADMLEKINRLDDNLMEDRLVENMQRIIENMIENLKCEIMEQIVDTLNKIAPPVPATTSTVHNEITDNRFSFNHSPIGTMVAFEKGHFQAPVNIGVGKP